MKKLLFLCAFALSSMCSFAETPVVTKVAPALMDKAVELGYGTTAQKQSIQNSRIIETMANEFLSNGFDAAKAVDKGAEVAVREGWFKSKESAKKHLKNVIETERKKSSTWNTLYDILGI